MSKQRRSPRRKVYSTLTYAVFTLFFQINGMSQGITENDTTRFFKVFGIENHQNVVRFYSIKNEQTFHIKKNAKNSLTYLMRDSIAVDSVENQNFEYNFNPEQSIILAYSGDGKSKRHYKIDLDNSSIERLPDMGQELLGTYKDTYLVGQAQKAKYIDEMPYIGKIGVYSPSAKKSIKEINLMEYLGESEGVIQVLVFEKTGLVLFVTALCYADGCENYKYILYNVDDNKLIKVVKSTVTNPSKIIQSTSGENFFLTQEHDYKNLYVGNVNLNPFDTVLNRNINVIGKALWDKSQPAYLFESQLDSKRHSWQTKDERVIIPAKVDLSLEKAISRIFHNKRLAVDMLSGFSLYDLLVLKNMIFAKHNYAFDSKYYQAFFNLYPFYNSKSMKASRTKDVNDKLTKIDIENLKLIAKALEG